MSLYPREVTAQMVQNFLSGGAAINVLCKKYGIENVIVDVGVDHDFDSIEGLVQKKVRAGTRNFIQHEALKLHQPDSRDPWDILKKVGGYEIGAVMGMVLGCAARL